MKNNEKISDLFLTLNYLNLARNYKPRKKKENLNIRKIWDVFLNPNKYDEQINEYFDNQTFATLFYKILKSEKVLYQPRMIAAASDKIFKRVSKDFELEIIDSNKNKNTVYVLLNVFVYPKKPLVNFYVVCKDQFMTYKIPPLNNNKSQILLQKDDKFYNLITNPDAEIFIR